MNEEMKLLAVAELKAALKHLTIEEIADVIELSLTSVELKELMHKLRVLE
jgi:hypothetical protein